MALTDAEKIAALEEELALAVQTTEYDGRRVTKRSVQEIKAQLDYFRARVDAAAGRTPVRVSLGGFFR